MSDKLIPPKSTKGDIAYAAVKSVLGAIPIVGAATTELLNIIVTPPLERRRHEWMGAIGNALRNLEEAKGINLENLRNNDVFLDIAIQATQTALRTSEKEKLEALKNAVLNATSFESPEESIQQMFLNFIDFLTVWHLRLLTFLNSPKVWSENNNLNFSNIRLAGMGTLIEKAFPMLRNKRDVYDQFGKDLFSRGLINGDNFHKTASIHSLLDSQTTRLGKLFINYITNPIPDA